MWLDFNLFHYLDTVFLYYVCVNWVTWSTWSWTFTLRWESLHVNVHIKWGSGLLKVPATVHLFAHNLQINNVLAFTTVSWFIHVIHSSPGRSVKGTEWFWGIFQCLSRIGTCLEPSGGLHVKLLPGGLHVIVMGPHHLHVILVHVRGSPRRRLRLWTWRRWSLYHVARGTTIMCSVPSCVLTQIVSMWKESLPVVCIWCLWVLSFYHFI